MVRDVVLESSQRFSRGYLGVLIVKFYSLREDVSLDLNLLEGKRLVIVIQSGNDSMIKSEKFHSKCQKL